MMLASKLEYEDIDHLYSMVKLLLELVDIKQASSCLDCMIKSMGNK